MDYGTGPNGDYLALPKSKKAGKVVRFSDSHGVCQFKLAIAKIDSCELKL